MKFPLIQAKRGLGGGGARARASSRARAKGKVKDNGNHGGRPPYPLYETIKMGEHVPSDKLTANGACGIGRFRHPINRVPRFIGSDEIKKQSQFLKMHSIILYINNKICFLKIRLSSENTAAAFFAKLCYNWKQSFRRRAHTICAGHLPSGRLTISAACRQTQTMRGICPLANWPPASRAELEGSAFLSIGYRPPQERGKHKLCGACALWQAGFQLRVRNRQFLPFRHPGIALRRSVRACAC
jgi:hypothetical protein